MFQVRNDNSEPVDAESAGIIMALQEELIAVRLREAESAETLKELREDIKSLEKVWQETEKDMGSKLTTTSGLCRTKDRKPIEILAASKLTAAGWLQNKWQETKTDTCSK